MKPLQDTLAIASDVNRPQVQIKEGMLLFILAAINFTHIMDFVIVAPLNPFLKEAFGINTREFGFLMSAYTLSAGLFGFVGFFFIDKFDRRNAILVLYLGFVVSNLLCALSSDYYFFGAARIFAGAFGGILSALILSIIGDAFPPERRGKATGIVMSAFSAASIIGIPIGLYLASAFSFHAPFFLLTILSAIVLLLVFIYFPTLRSHLASKSELSSAQMLVAILGNHNVRRALLFNVLLMIAGFCLVPYMSDYLVNNVHITKENLKYVYFFGGLATVVSGPLVGRFADKFGKQKVFTIMASLSLIPIVWITNLGPVSQTMALIVSTLFFIFFGGRFVPAMAMITAAVEGKNRGKFMSISSSVQQLSSSFAAFMSGLLIINNSAGEITNFYLIGIISVVATLLCIIVSFKVKQIS